MRGPDCPEEMCKQCTLGAKHVLGEGEPSGVMFVGEAPGEIENAQGRPFVGQTGKLLRNTIKNTFKADTPIYLTNSVLCRPPGNRTPEPEEVKACRIRLIAELCTVKPKIVVALGNVAITALFPGSKPKILSLRGTTLDGLKEALFGLAPSVPVIATLHPAYILRNPTAYRDLVRDIEQVRDMVESGREIPMPPTPTIISNVKDARKILIDLRSYCIHNNSFISVDIETDSLDTWKANIYRLGLSVNEHESIIFKPDIFNDDTVRQDLEYILKVIPCVAQNGLYDWSVLKNRLGIDMNLQFDTMHASYMLDERTEKGLHTLDTLATKYRGLPNYKAKMKEYLENGKVAEAPEEELHQYLAWDTTNLLAIMPMQRKEIEEDGLHVATLEKILCPASKAIGKMILNGIKVDVPYLQSLQVKFTETMETTSARMREIALHFGFQEKTARIRNESTGEMETVTVEFNPNSPKQVSTFLYDIRGGTDARRALENKTKVVVDLEAGKTHLLKRIPYNTSSAPIVKAIADYMEPIDREFADGFQSFKSASKANGTYVGPLLEASEEGDRVHFDFNLSGTVSGRLSSPMLTLIPRSKEKGIRKAFIAREGYKLVKADFSQLEFRVAAWISQDQKMMDVFRRGEDMHRGTAQAFYGRQEITSDERQLAKVVGFGMLYGKTENTISDEVGISVRDARFFINTFLGRFPDLRKWIAHQIRGIGSGQVNTWFGRRRRWPIITKETESNIKNVAVNDPIQSTAGDICLLAAIELHSGQSYEVRDTFAESPIIWIPENKLNQEYTTHLNMVHDDQLFEVREDKLTEVIPIIKRVMEKPRLPNQGDLVFSVEIEVGDNWAETEKWEAA